MSSPTTPQDPGQIRQSRLAARDRLGPEEIKDKSRAITERLLQLPVISTAQTLFVYVSFRSEVATGLLIDQLLAMGKNVAVPITRVAAKRLDAIRIQDRVSDLVPGYCRIPEPRPELCTNGLVPPSAIEAIILPGSVFDERGGRFGYGGGYYDRFVAATPKAWRLGLAYELQIIPLAPLAPHDELLDLVVTESRVISGLMRRS